MKLLTKKAMTGTLAAFAFALLAVFTPAGVVNAACDDGITGGAQNGLDCAKSDSAPDSLFASGGVFTTVVNTLLFVIGAVSVVMLIWGGIRYTTSAGNSSNVTAAKNTIMYAIIGLIIAFLAYAIVNWVLDALAPTA